MYAIEITHLRAGSPKALTFGRNTHFLSKQNTQPAPSCSWLMWIYQLQSTKATRALGMIVALQRAPPGTLNMSICSLLSPLPYGTTPPGAPTHVHSLTARFVPCNSWR